MLRKMKYFLIFLFSIFHLSNALTETSFTYRFGERLPKDYSSSCPWKCRCPDINLGNICNCQKQATPNETVTIESPYAALLVKMECQDQRQTSDWPPTETLIQVNLTTEAEKEPISTETPITIDISKDPLINDVKLLPKIFPIRYVIQYKSNRGDNIMDRFLYSNLGRRFIPNRGADIVQLIFLIPGWSSEFNKQLTLMKTALLEANANIAVVYVDWLFGNQFYLNDDEVVYEQAAVNSVYAGYHLASYVYQAVVTEGALSESFIHFIGFDLGSYVAKYAANKYEELINLRINSNQASPFIKKKIDRISSLDPPFHLFLKTPLQSGDADYVDVYHSNSMINIEDADDDDEDDILNIIKLNIRNRRFGDPRPLGDADFYINVIAEETKLNAHPQCDDISFGCPTMMAAQVFLDSILREEKDVFNVKNGEENVGVFGFYADADTTNGEHLIEYKHEICSFADVTGTTLGPFISPQEQVLIHGPQDSILSNRINGNITTFPLETPKDIQKSENEFDTNCGKFNEDGASKKDDSTKDGAGSGGRIYEGLYPDNEKQFPFAVCLMKKLVIYVNMEYFIHPKEKVLYKRPYWMTANRYLYPISERITTAKQQLGYKVMSATRFEQYCSGSLIHKNWILTAAHCGRLINDVQIKIRFGSLKCIDTPDGAKSTVNDESTVTILAEQMVPGAKRTIFLNDRHKDDWIEGSNAYLDEIIKYGFAPLSANDSWINIADPGELKYYGLPKDAFLSMFDASLRANAKSIKCKPKDKINFYDNYISLYANEPHTRDPIGRSSDIALIRINTENDVAKVPICTLTSVNVNNDQLLYSLGYGSKGTTPLDSNPTFRDKLAYTSGVTYDRLQNMNENITFVTPYVGFYGYKTDSLIFFANIDKDANGNIVTSAVCPGDSGGPLFAYAQSASGAYAVQVGLVSGPFTGKPTGSMKIARSRNPKEVSEECGKTLMYNVYSKQYMLTPQVFVKISKHVDWVKNIINNADDIPV